MLELFSPVNLCHTNLIITSAKEPKGKKTKIILTLQCHFAHLFSQSLHLNSTEKDYLSHNRIFSLLARDINTSRTPWKGGHFPQMLWHCVEMSAQEHCSIWIKQKWIIQIEFSAHTGPDTQEQKNQLREEEVRLGVSISRETDTWPKTEISRQKFRVVPEDTKREPHHCELFSEIRRKCPRPRWHWVCFILSFVP